MPILIDTETPTTDEILRNVDNFEVETWFERDRASVILKLKDGITVNETIPGLPEWWDESVAEAIEDGFLDPRDYLSSAHEYFMQVVWDVWQKWSKETTP